jgi:N-formylglutamate amidohydrolase
MGQIILSGEELICLLKANGLVPAPIIDAEMDTDAVKVRVRTPLPILKSVHVGVRFAGFEEGHVVLQLVTNRLLDTFDWLVDRMFASLQLADHGSRWQYPRLYVDVNRLLQQQVRGVAVTGMTFAEGRFHITTAHAVPPPAPAEASETSPGSSSVAPGPP